jgi:hypothetical protein
MNLKRLPIYLLVMLLVSSLAACVLPFNRPTPAPNPTQDNRVAMTLTAILANSQATAAVQPTSQPTLPPATAVPATAVSISPTLTPTTPPVATTVPTVQAAAAAAALSAVPATTMRILYTDAGRNLWIWQADGSTRQLVKTGDVYDGLISADGSVLVYIRTKDFKKFSVWGINPDGSKDRELITQDDMKSMKNSDDAVGAQPYVISWIPGTHNLAFVTSPTFDGPGLQVNDDLWELNADTGELTKILEPGQGGIFYYSPDGKQIALVTSKTISLINADGSNRRDSVLKFTPVNTYSEFLYYPTPKWAPDSSLLNVAIPPKDALSSPDQKTTLYEILTDGSQAKKIGTVTTAPLLAPEFSPDASRLIYVKVHGAAEDNQRELRIADPSGANDTVYRTAQLDFNGWAPDSTRFVYTEGSDTFLGQIGVDAVRLFTDTRSATAIDWLKNGQILFLHRISNGWQIKLGMPGGASEVLISLPGDPDNFMPNFAVKE